MNKRQRKKYVKTYMRIRDSIEKNPDPRYVFDAYFRPYRIGKRKAAIIRSMVYCLTIDEMNINPHFKIMLEWNPWECGDWITKFRKEFLRLKILPYECNKTYYTHRKYKSKCRLTPSLDELIELSLSKPIWVAKKLTHFYGIPI